MPENIILEEKEFHPFGGAFSSQLACAVSKRLSGNQSLFYGDTAGSLENRRAFLLNAGIDQRNLVCAKQTHGNKVRFIKEQDLGKGAIVYEDSLKDTDALITNRRQVPLAIFTADCLSIFIFDPEDLVIGLAHAGWSGTQEEIAVKTIESMRSEFNSKSARLRVALGPCIRNCCYEVGSDFNNLFPNSVAIRNGRNYFDLAGENIKQLKSVGVSRENIFDPVICTYCSKAEFYSFRREGNSCGRSMSVIMLK